MDDTPENGPDAGMVKYLRTLVTVLTSVMILGFIVLIALLVTRFPGDPAPHFAGLPESIHLPAGAAPLAYTETPDWYAIVTQDNRVLIFSKSDNRLVQTIQINPVD